MCLSFEKIKLIIIYIHIKVNRYITYFYVDLTGQKYYNILK